MSGNRPTPLLGVEQRDAVYRDDIMPAAFPAGAYPSAIPRATIVLAQPGIETTDLIEQRRRMDPNTVVITPERLRAFHPADELLRHTNSIAGGYPMLDEIEAWTKQLAHDAAAQRYNIVLRSTGIEPDTAHDIAVRLHDRGYEVNVHALAVHPAFSMLSLHQSYEGALVVNSSTARWISRFEHDAATSQLPKALEKLELSGAISKLHISDRAGEFIYANRVLKGYWQQIPGSVTSLHSEWHRAPEAHEMQRHQSGWDWVLRQMEERGAGASELGSAQRTANFGKGSIDMLKELDMAPINPYPAPTMAP